MTEHTAIKRLTSTASDSAARLKKILPPLWKALTFSLGDDLITPGKTLCVSVEKGSLTVIYGSRFLSQVRINEIRSYPLEGDAYPAPENLASSVALSANQIGISKAEITLSIPKAWAVIKVAEFPSTIKENISNVVSYELDRLTPFNQEDAYYDFKVLKEDNGKLTILVCAVKSGLIKPYIESLKDKGFDVTKVTANLSGIGTLCLYINKGADSLFLEIDENEYKCALFIGGSIRDIITDRIETADEKLRMEKIMSAIEPLIQDIRKNGASPRVVVLLKDKNPILKEMLKLRLDLPVRMLNEVDLGLSVPPVKDIPYEAIGSALESLWPKAKGLNLLQKGVIEKQEAPVLLTIVLMLAVLAMLILNVLKPFKVEQEKLKLVDAQIAEKRNDVKKVEDLKKEIQALNNEVLTIGKFKEKRPLTLDLMRELTTILPKTAWLTRVKAAETTVDIEGYSASATELLQKLEASKFFRKAEFGSPTFRDPSMKADRFAIKMEIEGVEKEEAKGPKNEKK